MVEIAYTPSASRKTATERPGGTNGSPGASASGSVTRNFRDGDRDAPRRAAGGACPRCAKSERAQRRPERGEAEEVAARDRRRLEARARGGGRDRGHADLQSVVNRTRSIVIASDGQRIAQSAQRMQRSSSFRMARVPSRRRRGRRASAASELGADGDELVERHELQARRRADVDAAAAEHAARAVEDRRHAAVEAARRLAPRRRLVERRARPTAAGSARRCSTGARRERLARGSPRSRARAGSGRAARCASSASARSVAPGDDSGRRDARRPLARGDRVDQQPRAVRQVAGDEDARRGRRERLGIDLRPAGPDLLDVARRRRRGSRGSASGRRRAAPCRTRRPSPVARRRRRARSGGSSS